MSQRCCHSSRWRHCPRTDGAFTHTALILGCMSLPSLRRPCGFVAAAPCPIDALHLCTGQVVIRRPPLLRWWRQLLWRSLHCCPRRDGAVAHVALASSSFPCCARCEGPEGLMLPHRRCRATIASPHQCCIVAAAVTLPSRCCHTVTVAPLLHLHRVAVAL